MNELKLVNMVSRFHG